MASFFKFAWLVAVLFISHLSRSVVSSGDIVPWDKDEKYLRAVKDIAGIHWKWAFQNNPGDCTKQQADLLAEAAYVAVWDMFSLASKGRKIDDNMAWNLFFVNDDQVDWYYGWTTRGTKERRKVFDNIAYNLDAAYRFYKHHNGNTDLRKVKITCKEIEIRPCKPKAAAYMAKPGLSEDNMWELVICPPFWTPGRFINQLGRIKPEYRNPSLIKSGNLFTYEHILIHEMMHSILPGFTDKIIDHQWNGVPVNGAVLSESFAWQHALPGPSLYSVRAVNLDTETNADNYAQYLNARWFDIN